MSIEVGLCNVGEAATRLGVLQRHLYNLITLGECPMEVITAGPFMRLPHDDIDRWLDRHAGRDTTLDHTAWLVGELQRLHPTSPRYRVLVGQLRDIVDRLDG